MEVLIFAILLFFMILVIPVSIMYLLLGYMIFNNFSSRPFMEQVLKVTVGGVNIYPLDFLLATTTLLILPYFIGIFRGKMVSKEARFAAILILLFLMFFIVKGLSGYFGGVPLQTIIRMVAVDVQCLYFFLPVLYVKSEKQLKRLLYFTVIISMLLPFGQLLLAGSVDTQYILKGQGTFRLGYGDSSLILAFAILAFFAWERKMVASVLPLIGLVMLAHRSAFIGIVVSMMAMSFLKGKKLKTNLLMGAIGLLAVVMLFFVQGMTSYKVFDKGVERIGETFEATGTTSARLAVIPQTFKIWSDNPLFGLGYADLYKLESRIVGEKTLSGADTLAFNILHSHNFLLTALSHTGLVGTVLMLSILAYGLVCARRLSNMQGKKMLGSYLFACLLFFIVFATMSTTFGSAGFLFWVLYGIVFWYFNEARKAQAKS